jgi:hypothetical protein
VGNPVHFRGGRTRDSGRRCAGLGCGCGDGERYPSAELPRRRRRRLAVSLDGALSCGKQGSRGHIPHHLSAIYWLFWTLEQLSAVLPPMHSGERLAWFAHRLVRLRPAHGSESQLREQQGAWSAEVSEWWK